MDDIDRASELVELTTQRAIEQARAKTLSVKDSADLCEECGFEIPSARQIAVPGCTLCVGCAAALEERQKHMHQA